MATRHDGDGRRAVHRHSQQKVRQAPTRVDGDEEGSRRGRRTLDSGGHESYATRAKGQRAQPLVRFFHGRASSSKSCHRLRRCAPSVFCQTERTMRLGRLGRLGLTGGDVTHPPRRRGHSLTSAAERISCDRGWRRSTHTAEGHSGWSTRSIHASSPWPAPMSRTRRCPIRGPKASLMTRAASHVSKSSLRGRHCASHTARATREKMSSPGNLLASLAVSRERELRRNALASVLSIVTRRCRLNSACDDDADDDDAAFTVTSAPSARTSRHDGGTTEAYASTSAAVVQTLVEETRRHSWPRDGPPGGARHTVGRPPTLGCGPPR